MASSKPSTRTWSHQELSTARRQIEATHT